MKNKVFRETSLKFNSKSLHFFNLKLLFQLSERCNPKKLKKHKYSNTNLFILLKQTCFIKNIIIKF